MGVIALNARNQGGHPRLPATPDVVVHLTRVSFFLLSAPRSSGPLLNRSVMLSSASLTCTATVLQDSRHSGGYFTAVLRALLSAGLADEREPLGKR